MRQMTATCPSLRARWRHLANAIELVHPSAHSSPQPIRQMDRFSRFCSAYGRKCLHSTMGAPTTRIAPSHGGSGPYESTTQTPPRSVLLFLHRRPWSVSILYNGLPVSPSKLPLPMLASRPAVIRGSLGPPESGTQMATWSFQPFLQGSLV